MPILSFPVYKKSVENINRIRRNGHELMFEVDATKLQEYFGEADLLDRIQWNFPHWKGKTNHKRNR